MMMGGARQSHAFIAGFTRIAGIGVFAAIAAIAVFYIGCAGFSRSSPYVVKDRQCTWPFHRHATHQRHLIKTLPPLMM